MHIKFLKAGKSAKSAQRYLLRLNDHSGKRREEVRILRGDPDFATAVADSANFKHKYTSVVIAFSPSDMQKMGERKEEVFAETLDLFERVAFAGLDPGQYTYYAVSHGDHIHIIVPRVELTSGKSLNIAPPRWRKDFDAVRDYVNDKYQLDRPDSLLNARAVNVRDLQYLKNKELKDALNEYFIELIEKDLIRTSDDIKLELAALGFEVVRQGKDYLTIKDDKNRKVRLKGVIYGKGFDVDRIDISIRREEEEVRRIREERAREVFKRIEAHIEKRAQYNARRYHKRDSETDFLPDGSYLERIVCEPISRDRHTTTTTIEEEKDERIRAKTKSVVRAAEEVARKRAERSARYRRRAERTLKRAKRANRESILAGISFEQANRRFDRAFEQLKRRLEQKHRKHKQGDWREVAKELKEITEKMREQPKRSKIDEFYEKMRESGELEEVQKFIKEVEAEERERSKYRRKNRSTSWDLHW